MIDQYQIVVDVKPSIVMDNRTVGVVLWAQNMHGYVGMVDLVDDHILDGVRALAENGEPYKTISGVRYWFYESGKKAF